MRPEPGSGGAGDRRARGRADDALAAVRRIPAPPETGPATALVTITDGFVVPTYTGVYFPCRPLGGGAHPEVEGAPSTPAAGSAAPVRVLVLGTTAPLPGQVLLAERLGGRWVAQGVPAGHPVACCPDTLIGDQVRFTAAAVGSYPATTRTLNWVGTLNYRSHDLSTAFLSNRVWDHADDPHDLRPFAYEFRMVAFTGEGCALYVEHTVDFIYPPAVGFPYHVDCDAGSITAYYSFTRWASGHPVAFTVQYPA